MTADEFKFALGRLAPPVADLVKSGFERPTAKDIHASFVARRRVPPIDVDFPDSAIRDFFSDYAPAGVEVGVVKFIDEPKFVDGIYMIGYVDSDVLAFDEAGVSVRDYAKLSHTIWECAENGEDFFPR